MSNFREFMRNQFYTDNDMYDFKTDDEIFESMADFITSLDPEQLNDDQLETVLDILEAIEIEPHVHDVEDDLDDVEEAKRLAGKTKIKKKIQARKYYRKNKSKIKRRKKKFKRSAEGRSRARKRKKMERVGRTATGRKKVRYRK